MLYKGRSQNPRSKEDGILIFVPARIFSQKICAFINNGTTHCFISPASVTKCGVIVESHNAFLELGDGKKVLSKGRAIDLPVITTVHSMKTDLIVSNLLYGVDVMLGMAWL